MGTIFKRGDTYYAFWIDLRGQRHKKTLATKDPKVAKERLRQYELVSTDPAAHSKTTLIEAIGDLLASMEGSNSQATRDIYREKGIPLVRVLGEGVELSDIDRLMMIEYDRVRRAAGVSWCTIQKEHVVLSRALKEARNRGLWAGDPAAIIPAIKRDWTPRQVWLDPSQATELLREIPEGRKLWVAIAMMGGFRRSEVERLQWEHVDLKAREMRCPGKKRAKSWRIVPICPSLHVMLHRACDGQRMTGPVVAHWGNVIRDIGWAAARVNAARTAAAAKRKGKIAPQLLPHLTPNDLRRTFGSWLKQEGIDSSVIAKLLGHENTVMVETTYGVLSERNKTDAIAALPRIAA